MSHCPSCARPVADGWRYCGSCGAPTTADEGAFHDVPGLQRGALAAHRAWLAVGAAVLVVALLLGGVAVARSTLLDDSTAEVAVGAVATATAAAPAGTTAAVPTASTAASPSSTSSSVTVAPGGEGVTTLADIFGPGCSALPSSGPGAPSSIVGLPVATAASTSPLLTTLSAAVRAAGFTDVTDTAPSLTVFAPDDDAFASLPPGALEGLLADPSGRLTSLLGYHVVTRRLDAAGLVAAGSVGTVEGAPVSIGGTARAPTVNGNPVVCGNIPTANATVFILGAVLVPPA